MRAARGAFRHLLGNAFKLGPPKVFITTVIHKYLMIDKTRKAIGGYLNVLFENYSIKLS